MSPEERVQIAIVSPSWIDRLGGWIESLPGPAWLFYVLLIAGLAVLNHAVFWMDGGLLFGSLDPTLAMFALYTAYWLALYQYLTGCASIALEGFRPLLDIGDSEVSRLNMQMRNLPRKLGLLAIALGIATALLWVRGDLEYLLGPIAQEAQTALPAVYYLALTAFLSASFFALIFRTVRQLRLVGKLHEQATNIDLLDLEPAHAFSSLTARTGVGLILLLFIISISFDTPWAVTAPDVISYMLISLLAIAVFVVPLNGMHTRLQIEQHRALQRTNEMIWTATNHLYQAVQSNTYDDSLGPDRAISALLSQREVLLKVSTWPWNPGTIRGFASTLLLPIFLLIVAQLLDRLL